MFNVGELGTGEAGARNGIVITSQVWLDFSV
jgi:hypothetical protein